jgi:hypothetical protein
MSLWPIIIGFGLDDWIYLHLLLQSPLIKINCSSSQYKWLLKTRSILTGLRLSSTLSSAVTDLVQSYFTIAFWFTNDFFLKSTSKSNLYYDRRSVGQCLVVWSTHLGLKTSFFSVWQLPVCWWGAPSLSRGRVFYNVQYIYMLHVTTWMYIHNIYKAFVSPGSVQQIMSYL